MSLDIDHTRSSPNHSSRDGYPILLILVHATVGSYLSSLNWLCSAASKASAHYLISKQGKIAQLVPDDRAAWHAGRAQWMGETAINELSLGIELENLTGMGLPGGKIHPPDSYPEAQLKAARALIQAKMAEYEIPLAHVVRHLDVAVPRGRKNDPANLNWAAFFTSIAAPTPGRYRVRGAAIHEAPVLTSPIALQGAGFLRSGEEIDIDEIKPGGIGHLKDGRGFVLLEQLERV